MQEWKAFLIKQQLVKFTGLILFVGFMMAGFKTKKQAIHDQISGKMVLSKQLLLKKLRQ